MLELGTVPSVVYGGHKTQPAWMLRTFLCVVLIRYFPWALLVIVDTSSLLLNMFVHSSNASGVRLLWYRCSPSCPGLNHLSFISPIVYGTMRCVPSESYLFQFLLFGQINFVFQVGASTFQFWTSQIVGGLVDIASRVGQPSNIGIMNWWLRGSRPSPRLKFKSLEYDSGPLSDELLKQDDGMILITIRCSQISRYIFIQVHRQHIRCHMSSGHYEGIVLVFRYHVQQESLVFCLRNSTSKMCDRWYVRKWMQLEGLEREIRYNKHSSTSSVVRLDACIGLPFRTRTSDRKESSWFCGDLYLSFDMRRIALAKLAGGSLKNESSYQAPEQSPWNARRENMLSGNPIPSWTTCDKHVSSH